MTHPDDDALAALALGEPAPSGVAEHVRGCPSCSDALAALRDTMTTLRAPVPELVAPPVLGVGRRDGRDRPRARRHAPDPVADRRAARRPASGRGCR